VFAAIGVLAAAAGAISWWWTRDRPGPGAGLDLRERMAGGMRGNRRLEPRLTGGFKWAPLSVPPVGATGVANLEWRKADLQFLSYGAVLDGRVTANPDDRPARAELGVVRLLLSDVSGAVQMLEEATEGDTAPAAWLSDLSAAYLVRAKSNADASEYVRALDVAGQALRRNPALTEARFNVALALEGLGAASLASSAWEDYLRYDRPDDAGGPGSWSIEARDRHALLAGRSAVPKHPAAAVTRDALTVESVRTLSSTFPDLGRELIEETLLLEWATALSQQERPDDAARLLSLARAAAAAVEQSNGDRYTSDLVAQLAEAAVTNDGRAWAHAFARAQEGRRLIMDSNDVDGAGRLLLEARRITHGRGALGEFIDYWRLLTDWYGGPPQRIEAPLRELSVRASRAGHTFLAARTNVFLGSVLRRLARYSEANDHYERGADDLGRLKESDAEANARMLLAASLRELGAYGPAWHQERIALSRLHAIRAPARRHNVIREAIRLTLARSQPDASVYFSEALVANAAAWGDAGARLESHILRGHVSLHHQNVDAARGSLGDAQRAWDAMDDSAFRRSYALELAMLRAEVSMTAAPLDAASILQGVLGEVQRSGTLFRRARTYLLLGRALAGARREAEAEEAWTRGIETLEDESANVREEQLRIARTSDIWQLYDELIARLFERGEHDAALAVAERGRARALLDSLARTQRDRPTTPTIDTAAIGDALVLYYVTLRDRIVIYVIDRGRLSLRTSPVQVAEVQRVMVRLRQVIAAGHDPSPYARMLHGALLDPVDAFMAPGRPVIIVPDGQLAAVPFAALQSPRTGRFVVEDRETTLAPSLALLRLNTQRLTREASAPRPRVLTIGDPAFALAGQVPLARLPGARREARQVAALYETPTVLLDREATAARFLREMSAADVVHFAGHAVSVPDYPSRSFLALAGTEADALVTPETIGRHAGRATRLVVLSGCGTADGDVARGEGVLSLARPFLAAGTPLVAATLWPIEDGDHALQVRFHERLRAGETAAAALRGAQLEALRRDGRTDLRHWSAFVLIGGREPAPRVTAATNTTTASQR
jgi:CHAT domain-containing protein